MVLRDAPNKPIEFSPQDKVSYKIGQEGRNQIIYIGHSHGFKGNKRRGTDIYKYTDPVYSISKTTNYSKSLKDQLSRAGAMVFTEPGPSAALTGAANHVELV